MARDGHSQGTLRAQPQLCGTPLVPMSQNQCLVLQLTKDAASSPSKPQPQFFPIPFSSDSQATVSALGAINIFIRTQ